MEDPTKREPDDDSLDEHEDAEQDQPLSPSSQIGRERVGGSRASGQEPGTETKEGWPMPDQSDTPPEWPEPTID
jgi:hypothetical protein